MVCLALLSAGGTVGAQVTRDRELGARVELGAGYDSNPLLSLDPNARSGDSVDDGPGPGGMVRALGDVYGLLGDLPWLGAALASDARLYHAGDVRHDTALSLLTGTQAGAARVQWTMTGGRYDASFGADNAWYGSLRPALRWIASPRLSVGIEAHGDARRYADGGQTNWDLGATLDLQLRRQQWMASLGVDVDRRESSEGSAERAQVTPFASATVSTGALSMFLRYAAFARWFDQGAQDGLEHTGELGARYAFGAHLSLSARVGAGLARGQAEALSYERIYALLGLTVTLGDAAARVVPPSEPPDRAQQGAAQVGVAATRFSVCVAGARDVSVVGTFNDWSAERGRMLQTEGDCYAITLVVPAGHHRYQWMIDGALRRPDDAPAYAPDGFGGEDAVLIVPE